MGDFLEFPDILQEVRGSMNPGRLKLQKDKVIFKNVKTGRVDQYSTSEIEKAHWLIRARGHCLKFIMSNGVIHRYDGFREPEYDKLGSFCKKFYNHVLEKKDVSTKGWNWGTANFIGNTLEFEVGSNSAFELPLNYVSHSTTAKNEVTLEFHQNDEAPMALMELRFHIPTDPNNEADPVEEFYTKVMQNADILQATGESIAILSEVQCLTPRGRYDIKIYPTFLQLHGKTFDYKIPYTTILRFFLLPLRDGRQMYFVISLDPPIKQGNTRYPFLILVFSKDVETSLELSLTDEQIAEKYEGKLEKQMNGPEYEIISRIMKTLVNRKITVPGSFVGHSGAQSISCSYKAATGALYPLERGFMFVHKPPIHIRFDEIAKVNFARSSGSTRSFDFDVETKNGVTFNFVGMEKDEYSKLYDFVTQKKLRVKNTGDDLKSGGGYNDDMLSSGDEEGGHDAYLERMKREGREKVVESEDESSEDEDFVAPESGSEVEEEFDTDFTDSSSEEEGEDGEKKKKEKKRKTITIKEPGMGKKRERKTSGSGGKRKDKKKKKDPNAPKKPMTAFFLWMGENREKIKADNPGISVTEVGKKGGEMWRALGESEKAKYEEEHKRLKDEYDEKRRVYLENKPASESDEGSPKPKKKKSSPSSSKPAAKPTDSKGGSGAGFKSKEFISDSESDVASESDSDEKPLKPKEDSKKSKKKSKKAPKKAPSEEEASSNDEEVSNKSTPPKARKSRRQAGQEEEKAELPSDEEEILSEPEVSEPGSANESGSD